MWYLILFPAISLFFILGITGCFSNQSKGNSGSALDSNSIANPDSIKGKISRAEMKKKLKHLSNSLAPMNLKKGAMCYEVAGAPDRAEYVCPVCGEKTLYSINHSYFVEYELQACRSAIDKIKGIDARLDESQFCRKCSPGDTIPELCLDYAYADDTTRQRICDISNSDMELLVEFTNGRKIHTGFNGTEYPLKDYADRLEELLGIKIKE